MLLFDNPAHVLDLTAWCRCSGSMLRFNALANVLDLTAWCAATHQKSGLLCARLSHVRIRE
jgi:hypothetical protein